MEPIRFWAAVEFTAQNGGTDALLTAAAQAGLHPYRVVPLPGGFEAHCAAWQYRQFAALARKNRVRLRLLKKQGLYFVLRPLLRRVGLWVGFALFVPLLLWAQGFVWAADYSALTPGQAARAAAVLRENGLQPGSAVTEEKLTAGEYALLRSGEFSWVSLNFAKGRLEVEAAAAAPKPDIAAGTLHGIRAKCGGVVVSTNLVSGTMLAKPGQTVEAGQGLIGTARSERDGTLIFVPAAGTVRAQFEWSGSRQVALTEPILQKTGHSVSRRCAATSSRKWFSCAPKSRRRRWPACNACRRYTLRGRMQNFSPGRKTAPSTAMCWITQRFIPSWRISEHRDSFSQILRICQLPLRGSLTAKGNFPALGKNFSQHKSLPR